MAAAVSRVVVVLPLVPETSATWRPAARCASRFGSIIRPIQPPITDPSPRPAARDRAAAVFDTDEATLARSGSALSRRLPRHVVLSHRLPAASPDPTAPTVSPDDRGTGIRIRPQDCCRRTGGDAGRRPGAATAIMSRRGGWVRPSVLHFRSTIGAQGPRRARAIPGRVRRSCSVFRGASKPGSADRGRPTPSTRLHRVETSSLEGRVGSKFRGWPLTVGGSGVQWGAWRGRGASPAPGDRREGRGGGFRCSSAPTLRASTTRAG